jgi:hypothetical protein
MGGIGHNRGPGEATGWRRHCWRVAREALVPVLPVEVVRLRVRRAAALGLDYRTYAGIRAQTGHDLVAFLFSSNALRVFPGAAVPETVRAAVAGVAAGRIGLAAAPLSPEALVRALPALTAAHPAPGVLAGWGETRARLRAALGPLPGDAVLLVAEHGLEAEWAAAGRLAGVIPLARLAGAAGLT